MSENVSPSTQAGRQIDVTESGSKKSDSQHTLTVIKANAAKGVRVELNGEGIKEDRGEKVVTIGIGYEGKVVVKTKEDDQVLKDKAGSVLEKDYYSNNGELGSENMDSELRRKSESPSEELIDSIEEEDYVRTKESGLQAQSNTDRTKATNEESSDIDNDSYQDKSISGDGSRVDIDASNESSESDARLPSEKEERAEIKSEEFNTKLVISNNGKQEEAAGGGGDEVKNDGGEEEEFRAMTEEEIQAIISKYSFMDRQVRVKCLQFFWSLDVERWGYFNFPMLRYWYRAQGSILPDEELHRIFFDLDQDRDNLVSLDEFLLEMSKKQPRPYSKEELEEKFKEFDKNEDGYICKEDIIATWESWDTPWTMYKVYDMLEYDVSGNNEKLNFREFSRCLQDGMKRRMPIKQWRTPVKQRR